MRLHPGDYWVLGIFGLVAIGFGFSIVRALRKPRVPAPSEGHKE